MIRSVLTLIPLFSSLTTVSCGAAEGDFDVDNGGDAPARRARVASGQGRVANRRPAPGSRR